MNYSRIVIGTWGIGGSNKIDSIELGWPKTEKYEALRLLEFCCNQGIRKYDTSDIYGRGLSESLLGEVIKGGAKNIKIITKGGIVPQVYPGTSKLVKDFSIDYLKTAVNLSLERLKLETLYGYLLHGIKSNQLNENIFLFADYLKKYNLIENFGISTSRSETSLLELSKQPAINFIETPYTLVNPSNIKKIDDIYSSKIKFLFRSILFHGILVREENYSFKKTDHRKSKINKSLINKIAIFHKKLKKKDISPLEATLIVALGSPQKGDIVYGAKSIEQTKQFLQTYKNCLDNYSENIRNGIIFDAENTFISQREK